MKQELIVSGKTIEAAVEKAVNELGVTVEDVTYEVLVQPKKGFLGFGEVAAQVKVIYNQDQFLLHSIVLSHRYKVTTTV